MEVKYDKMHCSINGKKQSSVNVTSPVLTVLSLTWNQ